MNRNHFTELLTKSEIILTEGAIVERLKNEHGIKMDKYLNHAALIYNERGRQVLSNIYRQYIHLSIKHQLPVMLMTPTRRVNKESIAKSDFRAKDIIRDNINFLAALKQEYPGKEHNILLGGLLGCKGEAYNASKALETEDAYQFHKIQVAQFSEETLNFLFAGIMPAVSEAIGMAKVMAESDKPYIISFMVNKNGKLLDGTAIVDAIHKIDSCVFPNPICYMANCIHPHNLRLALENDINKNEKLLSRIKGVQANASMLSPEELNNCNVLQKEDFDFMIEEMITLKTKFGFKILGGCCGTDEVFIDKLANSFKN